MLTRSIPPKMLLNLRLWVRYRRVLLLAIPTGIIAGIGSIIFYTALDFSHNVFLDHLAGYRPTGPAGEENIFSPTSHPFVRWMLIVVPALGGILSGWLVFTFAPETEGHGTDAALEAYHFKRARIRPRAPIIKLIASALTIGSGGSGGREGPIAQIGAGFGSVIAQRLGLNDQERRILMMAGMSAGIGSIFHAPLAGAIFAAEILYRDIDMEYELLVPSAITSVVAYCVFSLFFGFGSLFETPSFHFGHAKEIIPYTLLAVVVALAANVYIKVFYGIRNLFQKIPVKPHLKPALGGLFAGMIGYLLPESLYSGYGVLQGALKGELATSFLLAVAGAKILTTAFSIGSGGSGGVFGPSVVIGGAIGGAAGLILHSIAPTFVPTPDAFVLVGMAGFFASAASTPFSTVIMVSEMTGDYGLLLPAVWVSTLAFLFRSRHGIYEKQITTRYDTPLHQDDFVLGGLARLTVHEILERCRTARPAPVFTRTPLSELIRIITETSSPALPVTDKEGVPLGVVTAEKIKAAVQSGGLELNVRAGDLVVPRSTIYSWEPLTAALSRMATEGTDEIIVLSDRREIDNIVGTLARSEIMKAYAETLYSGQ